ncbi:hypothetical protein [Egicoccus halophilus]|uniref:Uncharacterized protein n=1 Tax=Egicoccus halophilus TaxID=1670830 RepID=A0A8J3ABT0_9ACTN|nr:hypothetical protein [Egicoccus halophilus]GGI03576.1 hypothetical protein GCM10011354_04720 [Egicoccus halophilus]
MSITTWNRLEPVPRSSDMRPQLRAELADPLWSLSRQWQFGEFAGEDAGTPIDVTTTVEVAPVTRYHPGRPGGTAASRASDMDARHLPLEAVVEQRPVVGTMAGVRRRVDGGQHLLRLLAAAGASRAQRSRWVATFPLDLASTPIAHLVPHDPAGAAWLDAAVGRVPDGEAVAATLERLRDDGRPDDLPDELEVPARQLDRIVAAADRWLTWWRADVDEPATDAGGDAWETRRLEYAFAVQARLSDGDVVLHADDYGGGRLDWFEFEADHRQSLGGAGADGRTLVRHAVPTPAYYGGMPADRFWEFEPTTVRFGATTVARTDLTHLLLDEFALGYGTDWFVVPVTLPTGSVAAVRELRVRDVFGVETTIAPTDRDGHGWRMYATSTRLGAAPRVAGLLHLPAVAPAGQEGPAIEEVAWFRDELANLVWAVEERTPGILGGAVERREARRRGLVPGTSQRLDVDVPDIDLVYRLHTAIPEDWHPLVPVVPRGADVGALELELRTVERVDADGMVHASAPLGHLLSLETPLRVAAEEVGREGRRTRLHWQLARAADGTYHSWLSHRVGVGRGEGSSDLAFDVSRPPRTGLR